MKVVGYGICGPGEADKYMRTTLESFKRVCDDTIILGNNITDKERKLIKEFGFHLVEDNREWGKLQWKIKQDFVKNHVSKLNPDWCVCLDMDEELDPKFTKDSITELSKIGAAFYFFVVNLWDDGWNRPFSFPNIRLWKFDGPDLDWKQTPVHCGLSPAWTYYYGQQSPFTLIHYGLQDKNVRMSKVERYKKYDKSKQYTNPEYYHQLEYGKAEPYNAEDVKKEVVDHFKSLQLNYKNPMKKKEEKYFVIKRLKDGFTFTVLESQVEAHLRPGFELVSDKPIGENVQEQAPENALECQECGFEAKSLAGLRAHSRKHK